MLISKKTHRYFAAAFFCLVLLISAAVYLIFRRSKPVIIAFRQVGIRSSNRIPEIAQPGDTVTLTFRVDSGTAYYALTPRVEIAGKPAIVMTRGDGYVASRDLDDDAGDGPVTFSIDIYDESGGSLAKAYSTTDGSQVEIDGSPPILEDVQFATGTGADSKGRITVSIRSSEPLGGRPDMLIAGVLPDRIERLDPTRFTAEAVLSRELKAGPVPLHVEFSDRVGNTGEIFTGGTGPNKPPALTYDPVPPAITEVGIASTNPESPRIARIGDTIVLSFAVSEPIEGTPFVDIPGGGNVRVMRIDELGDGEKGTSVYEAVTQLIRPIPEGVIGFSIQVIDRSGNISNPADRTTDGSWAYFRGAAPPPLKPRTALRKPQPLPYVGEDYGSIEHLGYISAVDPGGTMDLTIHFAVSINGAVPPGKEVRVVEEPVINLIEQEPVEEPVEDPFEEPPQEPDIDETPVEVQVLAGEDPGVTAGLGPDNRVVIDSPEEAALFGSYVEVRGRVYDHGNITGLRYEVSPLVFLGQQSEFLSGDIELDEGGAFSFTFATATLSGTQQVVITAEYGEERAESAKISLLEGDSDIPSFTVVPEGEAALVRWEPHPLAHSYSVDFVNVTDGSEAAERKIENISSPSRIKGLEIGHRYSFLLSAYEENGTFIGTSARKEIVAINVDTLKPGISEEYKRIRITWAEIPGAAGFDLERAVEGVSDFEPLARSVIGTEYNDTDVIYGRKYSYRVSPQGEAFFSTPVSGEPLAVPEDKTRVAVSWKEIKVADATVYGYYTFVAAGEGGLVIFDISDPEKPVNVGAIETSNAQDVAISEGYAYVADGDRGLRVIDIDTPQNPVEVGSRKTSDAKSIEIRRIDDETVHAIVADGEFGVKIMDVSNPKDPERIYTIQTADASDLILVERGEKVYAIVADGPGGVVLIDLDATPPVVVSRYESSNASGISMDSDLLFIADEDEGLKVLDLADLESPRVISTYELANTVDVSVSEDFAYIASETEGLLIFDVSSPKLPVFYDAAEIEGIRAVTARGSKVFAGGENGFHILDAFTKGESYEVASVLTDGKAYEVSINNPQTDKTYAYVADRKGGLKIFDVSMPNTLGDASLLAHIETEYCREVLAVGDYAYIADGPGGVVVVDLAPLWDDDPDTAPGVIGKWDTDGNARSLAYANELLYVADGNRGVKVIDVSNPERPVQAAAVSTEYAVNIKVADGYIFLADGDGGFRIYDADPESLALIATVDTANTRGLDVQNQMAYVAGSTGLSVIDVSSPAEPLVLGFYRTGYAEEVAVDGRLAYIAEGFNGLTILDVINPESPYIVSRSENKYTVGIAVSGKYAYLVDTTGLKIVEILIPAWALKE